MWGFGNRSPKMASQYAQSHSAQHHDGARCSVKDVKYLYEANRHHGVILIENSHNELVEFRNLTKNDRINLTHSAGITLAM